MNSSQSLNFASRLADALEGHQAPWAPQSYQQSPDFDEGDWLYWIFCGGRGTGKTDAGSYAFDKYMREHPGARGRIIAPTKNDAFESCVIGPSGIKAHNPEVWHNHNEGALYWPNGSRARLLGAYMPEDVERLRANTNSSIDWCEELAAWPKLQEAWDQARFGLRRGKLPRTIITTTPRAKPLVKQLLSDPRAIVSRATVWDNKFLPDKVREDLVARYGHSSQGRQELYGELIDAFEGALWTWESIESSRRERPQQFRRIVVAVDPSVSDGPDSDEAGICVAGLGEDGHGYILEDLSARTSPEGWAKLAAQAYHQSQADRIIAEVNNGGKMVALTIGTIDPTIPVKEVHATHGKALRAEPVQNLYARGMIHHVGALPKLEQQMVTFSPEVGKAADEDGRLVSPDRLDAMVWAIYELMLENRAARALAMMQEQLAGEGPTAQKALPAILPLPPSTLACGFNACGQPNAQRALVRGVRVALCPMHLEQLMKLRLAEIDQQPA